MLTRTIINATRISAAASASVLGRRAAVCAPRYTAQIRANATSSKLPPQQDPLEAPVQPVAGSNRQASLIVGGVLGAGGVIYWFMFREVDKVVEKRAHPPTPEQRAARDAELAAREHEATKEGVTSME